MAGTVAVLQSVAQGDLRNRVTVDSKDEVGVMGEALNASMDRIVSTISSVAETAQQLASASEEFSTTSQQISSNAEETSAQATVVSAAGEQVSTNIGVVASGSEEMLASIREIAKSSGEAARMANGAVAITDSANLTITKLSESSVKIGQVIKVISSIAEQTNLLALNATIEAARAGEKGRGFAVVANEVKELAKESAQSTEDIRRKVESIQTNANNAVQATGEIREAINKTNELSDTIAAAVEEQTATTNEMARNITEAAKGSSEIAANITGVAEAAKVPRQERATRV